ncbi:putative RTA1 domain protein, partial [Fistulina hepatica ATCC 64428]
SYWYYAPNKVAPIVFAILFLLSALYHARQCFRYESWKISFFLPWAATLFVAGFIAREVGAFHSDNLGAYIASSILLMMGPPVFENANYFFLGRVLHYLPYNSPIHPGRVVATFNTSNMAIIVLIAIGISKMTDSETSAQTLGRHLLQVALILQLVTIVVFFALTAAFVIRCRRSGIFPHNIRVVLCILSVSCSLIVVRTAYRTAEYFMGTVSYGNLDAYDHASKLVKQEWWFWVFEATFMFLNSLFLNVFTPAKHIPRNVKVYLRRDLVEVVGPGNQDNRPRIIKLVDPMDLRGLLTGTSTHQKYWEADSSAKQWHEMGAV